MPVIARRWQRAEGLALCAAGLVLFGLWNEGLPLWAAAALFFAPDLSFAAYLGGPRIGAALYNLVHVYAFGGMLMALGLTLQWPMLAALGALWLAHSGIDRAFGYGLKSPEGFSLTHLGRIGKDA